VWCARRLPASNRRIAAAFAAVVVCSTGCSVLIPHATPDRLPEYLAGLTDTDPGTRLRAATSLAELGEPAVPPLIALLKDPREDARFQAVRTLGRLGPAASPAVPDLVALLKDDELTFPSSTAEALAAIGREAVPALRAALDDDDDGLRYWAVCALGRMADRGDAGLDALTYALADPNEAVGFRSGEALVGIGGPAVPALVRALSADDPGARIGAAGALKRIGTPEALDALRKAEAPEPSAPPDPVPEEMPSGVAGQP